MIDNSKVVYIHRKLTNREVFYVGIGNKDRPYQKAPTSRSVLWHRVVAKHGYYIEIIRTGLTNEEACNIEIDLIDLIGRRDKKTGTLVNLTNGGEGVVGANQEHQQKRIICLNTGVIYKSIREYCKHNRCSHSTISGLLIREYSSKHNVRYLNGNNIVWFSSELEESIEIEKHIEINKSIDVPDLTYNYELDELTETSIQAINSRLRHLCVYSKMLLYLNSFSGLSIRKICKATGKSISSVHCSLEKSKRILRGIDEYSYKHKQFQFAKLKKLFYEFLVEDDYVILSEITKFK